MGHIEMYIFFGAIQALYPKVGGNHGCNMENVDSHPSIHGCITGLKIRVFILDAGIFHLQTSRSVGPNRTAKLYSILGSIEHF